MPELLSQKERQLTFHEQLSLLVRAMAKRAVQATDLQLRPATMAEYEQDMTETLYIDGERFKGVIAGSDEFSIQSVLMPYEFWMTIVGRPEAEEATRLPLRYIDLHLFYGNHVVPCNVYVAPDMPTTMFERRYLDSDNSVRDIEHVRTTFGDHTLYHLDATEEALILHVLENSVDQVDTVTPFEHKELAEPSFTPGEIRQIENYLQSSGK